MIALYIIGGIILLFALLLFCPMSIHAKYDESLMVTVCYLFVNFSFPKPPLTPEQEAKQAAKKAKKQKKKEEKKRRKAQKKDEKPGHKVGKKQKKKYDFKEIFARHGVSGLLSILKDITALFKKHFKKLRHAKIRFLSVDLLIAKGNAADTAVEYGRACEIVYPSVAELLSICRHGKYEVAVTPDFNGQKSVAKAEIFLSIRLFHLVSLALGLVFGAIRLYLRFRKGRYETKKPPDEESEQTKEYKESPETENSEIEKGGATNEQSD